MKPIAPFRIGAQRTGLAARKSAQVDSSVPKEPSPAEMEHRIGIVFDDSGSMASSNKITDAHAGVEEFLRSCEAGKTAVTIAPMCSDAYPLTTNLPALSILVKNIRALGDSTPLLRTLRRMKKESNLTRAIVFSDGIPDSTNLDGITEEFGIVDTILISSQYGTNDAARNFMRSFAERTGGIFLEFKAGQSNFRTAFKYLSPGLRYMLADKSFVEQIQK
jgi:hypothetical protein